MYARRNAAGEVAIVAGVDVETVRYRQHNQVAA
jgi:hypothetical protein